MRSPRISTNGHIALVEILVTYNAGTGRWEDVLNLRAGRS